VLAAVDPDGGVEGLIRRLNRKFQDYNLLRTAPYKLSISIGVAVLEVEENQTLEDLLALADRRMYENKRTKKQNPEPDDPVRVDSDEAVA
jgi:GGDEF domain-containing protein